MCFIKPSFEIFCEGIQLLFGKNLEENDYERANRIGFHLRRRTHISIVSVCMYPFSMMMGVLWL